MTMLSASAPYRSIATRIGLTIGGGSAGTFAVLAFAHRPGMAVLAAAAAGTAIIANAIESICRVLPDTINAIRDLLTARTRARADAKKTIMMTKLRAELARSGIDSSKTAQAAEMLWFLAIDPDMPEDRRLNDEMLSKHMGTFWPRNNSRKLGSGPENPGNGSKRPRSSNSKVVPLRSE